MRPPGRCRCPAERRERALTFLAQLFVRSSGYRLRGVYGWANPKTFAQLAGPYEWAVLLAGLAGAGLVDEQTASVCGVEDPARLYRITQAGMGVIAGVLREFAPTVGPPGPADCSDGVYASEGAVGAGRTAGSTVRNVAERGRSARTRPGVEPDGRASRAVRVHERP